MRTPTTDLVNPLKELRLQLQMTPEQMANIANIQLAAIGQAEDGFYPNPLPSYLLALGIKPGTSDETEMIKAYHDYQITKRRSNGPATNNSRLTLNPSFSVDQNPLLTWRIQSGLATYGFCSAFCVHMPNVNNFEKNLLRIHKIPPNNIMLPLIQAGFNMVDGLLDEFTEACLLYKAAEMNKIRNLNNLPLAEVS